MEDIEKYLGWGALGLGLVTSGAGLYHKSAPATIAGVGLSAVGAFLVVQDVLAEPPPDNGDNGNGEPPPGEAKITAFAVSHA